LGRGAGALWIDEPSPPGDPGYTFGNACSSLCCRLVTVGRLLSPLLLSNNGENGSKKRRLLPIRDDDDNDLVVVVTEEKALV
jgi:hypothetical protein